MRSCAVITPEGGAVNGIDGGQALGGEDQGASDPGCDVEQTGDVLLPGDSASDARGPGGEGAIRSVGGGLDHRVRCVMNEKQRERQGQSGRQQRDETTTPVPAAPAPRGTGIILVVRVRAEGTKPGRVIRFARKDVALVADAPEPQIDGDRQPQSDSQRGQRQQHDDAEREIRIEMPPAMHMPPRQGDHVDGDERCEKLPRPLPYPAGKLVVEPEIHLADECTRDPQRREGEQELEK